MATLVLQHRSTFGNAVTSLALAFSSNVTAGSLLVYCCGNLNTGSITTDNNTNTIANAVLTGTTTRIDYVASANAGATTVTAHCGVANNLHLHIWEISGCVKVSPLRDSGAVASSATGSVATAGTSTRVGDAAIAFFDNSPANSALVKDATATLSEVTNDAVGVDSALSEFREATTAGTQTLTCTGNGANLMHQLIATFKGALPGWNSPTAGPSYAI